MAIGEFQDDLTLGNLCNGELEAEFQDAYRRILDRLKQGQTGKIGISVEIKRMENTDTMIVLAYSMNAKTPSSKRTSVCQLTQQGLKTDRPKKVTQLEMVRGAKAVE